MNWVKTGKTVTKNGTVVTYDAQGSAFTIESRKKHIPHANGVGTWDHTSYFVIRKSDGTEKEFYRLTEAKKYAEGGQT